MSDRYQNSSTEIASLCLSLDTALQLCPGASVCLELRGPECIRVAYLAGSTLWVWRLGRVLCGHPVPPSEVGRVVSQVLADDRLRTIVDEDDACVPSGVSNGGR